MLNTAPGPSQFNSIIPDDFFHPFFISDFRKNPLPQNLFSGASGNFPKRHLFRLFNPLPKNFFHLLFLVFFLLPGISFAETENIEKTSRDKSEATGDDISFSGDKPDIQRPSLTDEERRRLHDVMLEGRAYRARVQAAILLGRQGDIEHDLPALRRALRYDSHYTVRGAAAMAIGNLGSPKGIDVLFSAAGDPHNFVRRSVHRAIDELAVDEKAIPHLVLAREREDVHIRLAAINALGRLDNYAARQAIGQFLGDRDERVRTRVEEMINSWVKHSAVSVILEGLGNKSSFHVRGHAAELSAAHPDVRLIDALLDILLATLEEPGVQVAARESLNSMKHLLDTDDLIKRLKGMPDRNLRIQAIILLGVKGGDKAVDVLLDTLKDPDIRLRYHAVMALGSIGDTRVAPALVRMRDDPENSRIRGTITAALQDLSQVEEP